MNAARRIWLLGLYMSLLLGHAGCRSPQFLPSTGPDQTTQPADVMSDGCSPKAGELQASEEANTEAAPQTIVQAGYESVPAATTGGNDCSANRELTLFDAIQIALARNPDMASAADRVEIADWALARARRDFFPKFGFSADAAASNNPQTAFAFSLSQGQADFTNPNSNINNPGVKDDIHPQINVQHDFYTGGRRLAQKRSAEASLEASRFGLAEMQNQLVSQVAEAYYRLLQAREFVEVRQEAVEQVNRQLEVVGAKVKSGTAMKSDVLTVEVRLAEVEEALINARNQLELSWALLERVMGSHVESRTLPKGVPPAPWSDRIDELEAIVAEAIQNRPELGRLANTRAAAEHDIRVARSGRYPTISASSSYDIHTPDLREGNQSFYVGLGVRLLLVDGGRTRAEVNQAEAKMREIEARHASQVLEIELEVRRAYLELANAQERLRVTTKAVALSQASLADMEVRYRVQKALLTQLIDAQVAMSNARARRASAAADVEVARAVLQRVAGRLANFPGDG